MALKRCSKCKETKDTDNFHKDKQKKDGFYSSCKICTRKYDVERYKTEHRIVYAQVYKKAYNKRPVAQWMDRRKKIINLYNSTEEYVRRLMDDQRGCCAICEDSLQFPTSTRSYHIDHDHDTMEIRGLLCHWCNLLLGNAKDDTKRLKKAIDYLRRYHERR